jgi:hypothetical protein
MIETNTINASKKREFHKLGSGSYKVAMPKWDKMEYDCIARGLLTVNFRQPSHEFTFGVGINFISYPLVLTPMI